MGEGTIYEDEMRLLTRNIILQKENAELKEKVKWLSSRIAMLQNKKYRFLLNQILNSCKTHKH